MTLQNFFGINYNLKCIRRIMKKYNIVCPHRKANPYRRMMKATKEHTVLPNLLKREFKQDIPAKVLLTDITYLFFKSGQKAYLSTILDASTNEVLAHNVSKSLKIYNGLFNPPYAIRMSTKDFGYNSETKIKSVPLYATFLIKDLIK